VLRLTVAVCATPRTGATALLEALRGACPGAREYPDAQPADGVYVAMLHWAQMPAVLPPARDTRFVYLTRADRVAQAVSWAVAAAAGRFHSTQPGGMAVLPFDRAAVQAALGSLTEQDRCWREWLAGKPVLEVCYERDLNGRYPDGTREILSWLGVQGEPAAVTLRPVDVATKQDWLRQWHEATA
jgi:LPS sulfotransferase NodH